MRRRFSIHLDHIPPPSGLQRSRGGRAGDSEQAEFATLGPWLFDVASSWSRGKFPALEIKVDRRKSVGDTGDESMQSCIATMNVLLG